MTATRYDWALIVGVLCGFGLLWWLVSSAQANTVDRPGYAAGWSHAVSRQGGGPGAASVYLRTDAGMDTACAIYADGFAQLDGVQNVEAFLAGCHDAVVMTHLEPTAAELRDEEQR